MTSPRDPGHRTTARPSYYPARAGFRRDATARDPAAGRRALARAEREHTVEHVERLAHLARARVGPEQPRALAIAAAGEEDARVRLAASLAVKREEIVKTAFFGRGAVLDEQGKAEWARQEFEYLRTFSSDGSSSSAMRRTRGHPSPDTRRHAHAPNRCPVPKEDRTFCDHRENAGFQDKANLPPHRSAAGVGMPLERAARTSAADERLSQECSV